MVHIWMAIDNRQQRYKCKECGCNFTKSKKKGYSMRTKIIALVLYLSGVSMTMTGKIIGVSCQTIMRWIRELADRCGELPKPSGKTVELELDEICHFLLKKSKKSGYGRLYVAEVENLLDGILGIVVKVPSKNSMNK
uniref:Transposase n=1 Tax=uncultured Nitrospirae bacterium MY4-5C TaxID=798580 RepID=D9MP94_9BACT|nr:transposase [uncultured Nitrospirae bacterium MY4-5C]